MSLAEPHQCHIESSERLHQPCVVAGFVVILVDHAIELCFRLLCGALHTLGGDSNLVDPASSHMLVSKIKPCMSQYKLLYGETANGSLKQL